MPSWTIALIFGIALPAWFPRLPELWPLLAAIVILAPLRYRWRSRCIVRQLGGWLLAGLVGLSWGVGHGHRVAATLLPPGLEGEELRLDGRIVGLPAQGQTTYAQSAQRFRLAVEQCRRADGSTCPVRLRHVQLGWYDGPPVAADQHWRLTVRLKRPHGYANVGGFDYESWLVAQGVGATGTVRQAGRNELLGPPRGWHPAHWRQRLRDALDRQLADYPSRPLLLALLVGDGAALAPAQWERLRATGTVHLFVVSGLHIGMSGGLLLLLARLWRRTPWGGDSQRAQWLAWLLALGGATAYALVAGFGLPVQRALVMFAVAGIALAGWRERRARDAWLLALLVLLLWDPLAVLQVGFWFSFLAVAAILAVLAGRRWTLSGWRGWLARGWQVQWATFAMSVPVLLGLSGAVPLTGLLANAVAIPWVSLLALPAALVALIAELLTGWEGGWWLADAILRLLWWLLGELAARGEPLTWRPGGWGAIAWFCVGGAALLALLPRPFPGHWLAPLLVLPLLWPRTEPVAPGVARATVFDVGQGLAVLVQTRHHALLYDTGALTAAGTAVADLTVVPALRRLGVERLDLLVISHDDSDHAGGRDAVRAALPVRAMLSGEPGSADGETACAAGQGWEWDDVRFTVLHPAWQASRGNDNSCVIRVEAGGGLLLTGDIERGMEHHLASSGLLGPAAVVLAPHHGSRSSSSTALVAATRPRYVIIAAGYRNHFNHPDADVVARWQGAGATLLSTAETGMLRIRLDASGAVVEARHRSDRPRFWQRPLPAE